MLARTLFSHPMTVSSSLGSIPACKSRGLLSVRARDGGIAVAATQNELCVSVIRGTRPGMFADEFCTLPSPSSRQ